MVLDSTLSVSAGGKGSRASIRARGGEAMATEPLDERQSRLTDRSRRQDPGERSVEQGTRQDTGRRGDSSQLSSSPQAVGRVEERDLLRAVACRDEEACRELICLHHDSMVRLARGLVRTHTLAEEVVQETWMAMLQGLPTFEGRSSLKTWLFGILIRQARAMSIRERRTAAFSQLAGSSSEDECDPMESFFHDEGHPDAGAWAMPPQRWQRNPEDAALEAELHRVVGEAIRNLPEAQRVVVVLRDGEGWETDEVAALLDKTANWVRVNLHRARVKIRLAIARRLGAQGSR